MAGVLLDRIVYWDKYGRAQIPGTEGHWTAHDRMWWQREASLSPRQYDRAIAKLAKMSLIEKRQWWFARHNILHVRPTERTRDYLAAATTWEAADAFLSDIKAAQNANEGAEKIAENGDPSLPKPEISNGFAETGMPSSPNAAISNNIGNQHAYFVSKEKILTGIHPYAVPKKNVNGEDNETNDNMENVLSEKKKDAAPKLKAIADSQHLSSVTDFTLKDLVALWHALLAKHHAKAIKAGEILPTLSAKDKGSLAKILTGLGEMYGPSGPADLRSHAKDILILVLREWPTFAAQAASDHGKKQPKYPDAGFLDECLDTAVNNLMAKI